MLFPGRSADGGSGRTRSWGSRLDARVRRGEADPIDGHADLPPLQQRVDGGLHDVRQLLANDFVHAVGERHAANEHAIEPLVRDVQEDPIRAPQIDPNVGDRTAGLGAPAQPLAGIDLRRAREVRGDFQASQELAQNPFQRLRVFRATGADDLDLARRVLGRRGVRARGSGEQHDENDDRPSR